MASQSARDRVFRPSLLRSSIYRTPLHCAVREPVLGGDERPAPTRRGVSTVSRAAGVSHVYRGAMEARARNECTVDKSVRQCVTDTRTGQGSEGLLRARPLP